MSWWHGGALYSPCLHGFCLPASPIVQNGADWGDWRLNFLCECVWMWSVCVLWCTGDPCRFFSFFFFFHSVIMSGSSTLEALKKKIPLLLLCEYTLYMSSAMFCVSGHFFVKAAPSLIEYLEGNECTSGRNKRKWPVQTISMFPLSTYWESLIFPQPGGP